MKKSQRVGSLLVVTIAAVFLSTGCSTASGSSYQDARSTADCGSLDDEVLSRVRNGDTSGNFGELMGRLQSSCPSEAEVAGDYASGSNTVLGVRSCAELAEHLRIEAVKLLNQDGYCENTPEADSWPNAGLGWNTAREYAGTYQRICGPLTSLRNTYDGAFANVGLDYPDPGRFTFVMWGFQVDPIPTGTTVCANGNIYLYEGGVAQMELGSPSELELWD